MVEQTEHPRPKGGKVRRRNPDDDRSVSPAFDDPVGTEFPFDGAYAVRIDPDLGLDAVFGLVADLFGVGREGRAGIERLGPFERPRCAHDDRLRPALEAVHPECPALVAGMVVADDVPEAAAQQEAPRVERSSGGSVGELDRRPSRDGGSDHREFRAVGNHGRHGRAFVAEGAAEFPDGVLAGRCAGVHGGHRDLQRTHLVGSKVEIGEFVRPPIDHVSGLAGERAAGDDLGLDRHADVTQRRLVAFERRPPGLFGFGVLAVEFAGDLDQAQWLVRLEQQRQQIGEAFDPIDHVPPTLPRPSSSDRHRPRRGPTDDHGGEGSASDELPSGRPAAPTTDPT